MTRDLPRDLTRDAGTGDAPPGPTSGDARAVGPSTVGTGADHSGADHSGAGRPRADRSGADRTHPAETRRRAALPLHLVHDDARHGVALYARQVAEALGAPVLVGTPADAVAEARRTGAGSVHVHWTDRLFGDSSAKSAAAVVALAAQVPTTLTLHDVPQPWAGEDRAAAYAEVVRGVRTWAVNSHHEADLLAGVLDRVPGPPAPGALRSTVVHLPVVPLDPVDPADAAEAADAADATEPGDGVVPQAPAGRVRLALLGFVYPDKGHRELVRAASALAEEGHDVEVVALGAPVAGHDDLLDELAARARTGGVGWRVTGYLGDADLAAWMRAVDVPVTGHRHVSASGSMNSWLAAGRRPLALDGPYVREVDALRPGGFRLYDDDSLVDELRAALADPSRTHAAADDLRPLLSDTARAYAAWWAGVHRALPHPPQPVLEPW
ncbi:hypothetical protein [Nocardioides sp. P86]|uniref:hypothetical protein n=1 Tax=Nocardioides sp. P86 TaxID=2939569 RepID=UPI00203BFECF|nr:hypothetical protein [Nocardioides sp. P86]MCM3516611.1 hypothetical protein [Nocardioides sp. P86]